MKRIGFGVLVGLISCAAATSASADTYCVVPESSCPADHTYPDLKPALTKAGSDSSADTVKLGAATYSAGPYTASGNTITVVGKGPAQTMLTISGTTSDMTVLTIGGGSSVSSVAIVIPPGSTNTGLNLSGNAEQVAISAASGSSQSTGVNDSGPASAVIDDSTISATNGLTLTNINLFGSLTARHDTVIGDGSAGSVGAAAIAGGPSVVGGTAGTLTLDDSILRNFNTDFKQEGTTAPFCDPMNPPCTGYDVSANISFQYDDLDSTPPSESTMPPGSIADHGNNVSKDPGFVLPTASPPDYHLRFDSQLIDKGMSTVEPGESTQDEDGNPRTVGSATDIGAYEYQHRPPTITTSAAPTSGQTGSPFSFTASASDPDPGDTVTPVSWSFDDGASGSGASVSHAFSTPGVHTATATVTDSTGLTTTATSTVTVTAAPPPPRGSGPHLTNLKLTPAGFRAASSLPSVAAAKTGTTVSYTDSEAGITTFRVERAAPGIKRGRSCVRPSRRTRASAKRSKRCTLFVPVDGSFTHTDTAGANSFHFTGWIGGKRLGTGNYRLDATPQNAARVIGQVATAQFHVIAPPRKRRRHR